MARYRLASHVHVCRDEDYIVILDLRRDRYYSFEAARTSVLAPVVAGWPAVAATAADLAGSSAEVLASLARRGWLLETSGSLEGEAADAAPIRVVPPEAELLDPFAVPTASLAGARISLRTILIFVSASVFAKYALRFWPLERVVRRVAIRKAARAGSAQTLDVGRTRQLVDTFARLRVFLFSHHERCLHDSLSLVEFLARHDVFPSWVFGVNARPFTAHCWVQHGELVFNDSVEHSSTYTPIMAI